MEVLTAVGAKMPPAMSFSVDTHLFRELGELLVGRASTGLVELIKNAYDADASQVVVYGERLDSTKRGFILVSDDGVGMSLEQFEQGFMRVASRQKRSRGRRTRRYKRHFTGEKGVGRLAAHKLARRLDVDSVAWRTKQAVVASIDWDRGET